jgi:SEC-C motif-containing protein
MKSRFTAFAVGDINYIAKTAINQNDKDELKEFSRNCDFKSLEILDYGEDFVTFKATIFCQGQESSFIEKSYFKKVNGKWLYERGEFL